MRIANNVHYITNALRKAIMERSGLENNYVRHQTNEILKSYKKEISAVSFIQKVRKNIVNDNETFWEMFKPILSDKVTNFPKISLVEI